MARREDAAPHAPRGVSDPEGREGSRVGGRANPGIGKSAEKNAHNGGVAPAGRDETVRARHGRDGARHLSAARENDPCEGLPQSAPPDVITIIPGRPLPAAIG